MIYFITSNKNKLTEVQTILPEVKQLDIDLPEIQGLDAQKIIREKLLAAFSHAKGEFIVEDTSLHLDCLNGLPGSLIKWFLQAIGNQGLAQLAEKMGDDKAEAVTMIGYAKNQDEMHFFEGRVKGKIVASRGETKFGWDPIFIPNGYDKTFTEMGAEEKNKISMRRMALNKLKDFLASRQIK